MATVRMLMGYPQGADQPPANGQRKLLTPTEVASFLQVKLPRVYELVRGRRLRAYRIGRQLRFRIEDLEALLERSLIERSTDAQHFIVPDVFLRMWLRRT